MVENCCLLLHTLVPGLLAQTIWQLLIWKPILISDHSVGMWYILTILPILSGSNLQIPRE